jgi:predicted RNA binding protein YcfA (HicA-like mRNA interferase family)
MKLPRDLSGPDLAKVLRSVGYEITRQTGSHMRLTPAVPALLRAGHRVVLTRAL